MWASSRFKQYCAQLNHGASNSHWRQQSASLFWRSLLMPQWGQDSVKGMRCQAICCKAGQICTPKVYRKWHSQRNPPPLHITCGNDIHFFTAITIKWLQRQLRLYNQSFLFSVLWKTVIGTPKKMTTRKNVWVSFPQNDSPCTPDFQNPLFPISDSRTGGTIVWRYAHDFPEHIKQAVWKNHWQGNIEV